VDNLYHNDFYPSRTKNVESTNKYSFMSLRKVRLSLHGFPPNPIIVVGTTSVPNIACTTN